MRLYQYLFYKFYSLSKSMEAGNIVSAANAYFAVSVLLGFNLVSVMCVIDLAFDRELFSDTTFYLLSLSPLIFVYYFSLHKQKYLIDNKLFKDQPKSNRMIGTILVIIYCLATFWLIWYYGSLMRLRILKIDA